MPDPIVRMGSLKSVGTSVDDLVKLAREGNIQAALTLNKITDRKSVNDADARYRKQHGPGALSTLTNIFLSNMADPVSEKMSEAGTEGALERFTESGGQVSPLMANASGAAAVAGSLTGNIFAGGPKSKVAGGAKTATGALKQVGQHALEGAATNAGLAGAGGALEGEDGKGILTRMGKQAVIGAALGAAPSIAKGVPKGRFNPDIGPVANRIKSFLDEKGVGLSTRDVGEDFPDALRRGTRQSSRDIEGTPRNQVQKFYERDDDNMETPYTTRLADFLSVDENGKSKVPNNFMKSAQPAAQWHQFLSSRPEFSKREFEWTLGPALEKLAREKKKLTHEDVVALMNDKSVLNRISLERREDVDGGAHSKTRERAVQEFTDARDEHDNLIEQAGDYIKAIMNPESVTHDHRSPYRQLLSMVKDHAEESVYGGAGERQQEQFREALSDFVQNHLDVFNIPHSPDLLRNVADGVWEYRGPTDNAYGHGRAEPIYAPTKIEAINEAIRAGYIQSPLVHEHGILPVDYKVHEYDATQHDAFEGTHDYRHRQDRLSQRLPGSFSHGYVVTGDGDVIGWGKTRDEAMQTAVHNHNWVNFDNLHKELSGHAESQAEAMGRLYDAQTALDDLGESDDDTIEGKNTRYRDIQRTFPLSDKYSETRLKMHGIGYHETHWRDSYPNNVLGHARAANSGEPSGSSHFVEEIQSVPNSTGEAAEGPGFRTLKPKDRIPKADELAQMEEELSKNDEEWNGIAQEKNKASKEYREHLSHVLEVAAKYLDYNTFRGGGPLKESLSDVFGIPQGKWFSHGVFQNPEYEFAIDHYGNDASPEDVARYMDHLVDGHGRPTSEYAERSIATREGLRRIFQSMSQSTRDVLLHNRKLEEALNEAAKRHEDLAKRNTELLHKMSIYDNPDSEVPDNPFRDNQWVESLVGTQLAEAARKRSKRIGFLDEESARSTHNLGDDASKIIYAQEVPKRIKRILKFLNVDPKTISEGDKGFSEIGGYSNTTEKYHWPSYKVTDELLEAIKKKGIPLLTALSMLSQGRKPTDDNKRER